ncbi:L,D-transpeptidase family protein [Stappia taiwanensis]|uniref:L,D-transpeptidase family protein n=1 Tax=Stappia taiwanensis TaxID=992267 RepID=A0A838XRJ9_9HYPH|nr:L,D-transpeptidase family protein [Stappia taiwanensis]MBA4611681.1 L,D-transpeptidase family protein [Stappia taiwanensis]GGE97620.1 murein L,D-transpeptidase [Stappia taiwanensis]
MRLATTILAASLAAGLPLVGPLPLAAPALAQSAAQPTAQPEVDETTLTEFAPAEQLPTDPLAFAIAAQLDSADSMMLDAALNAGSEEETELSVRDFYQQRLFQPLWLSEDGLNPFAKELLVALENAGEHALDPEDYDPDRLAQLAFNAAGLADLAALDVALSSTYVTYASHLAAGRVKPNRVNKSLKLFPLAPDPVTLLDLVDSSESFTEVLEGLSPNTPNYDRLKDRLADYRAKQAAGGFTAVPSGPVLKPGMTDDRLEALRARMIEEDLLAPGSHSGDVYDGALLAAVKLFQERHGLEVDGIIGKNTLVEINVPIAARIEQMALNMERRRWMPDDLGERYVFINLADQNLKVVDNDKTVHTTRVVVGKPYHATPVFSDQITYAEINPFWTVPFSIATKEYLPQLQRNPGALAAKNIRIFSGNREISPYSVDWNGVSRRNFSYTLRQDPGPRNALGRIKFMFPNKYSIYIHDTPSKALFSRAQRSFSHGCIRAENPFDLGEVLLARDGWSKDRLIAARDTKKRRIVKLKEPIPVHLTYLTAWVNKDGSTHFRRDVYGRDKVLKTALTTNRRTDL